MSLLPVGIGSAVGGYQIERSLRFNSADSAYLNRTPASAGNRKTWTWSGWVKRGKLGSVQKLLIGGSGDPNSTIMFYSGTNNDALSYVDYNAAFVTQVSTSALYRDASAWYHIVVAIDTTQATASNRVKMYVNGVQITSFGTATYPSQNYDTFINNNTQQTIGGWTTTSEYLDGYLTEINFIDGQALTPTSFGEFNSDTGVWQPKKYTGTYGTNGFYLNFSDNSGTTSTTLGKDSSGNGNNWTPNNFSVTAGAGNDSLVDSPTRYGSGSAGGDVRGNFCTLNPLDKSSNITTSNGNLDLVGSGNSFSRVRASIGMTTGKWYAEFVINTESSPSRIQGGIMAQSSGLTNYLGTDAKSWSMYESVNILKINNNSTSVLVSGGTLNPGEIQMFAYDADSGKLWFGKDGSWFASGDPAAGTNEVFSSVSGEPMFFASSAYNSSDTGTWNFGARPFAYTAPSGFRSLVTTNLPTPTIADGGEYFNAILYTGTGSSLGVTGVGFQPDWVWIKERSGAADHGLYDVLRGVQNQLESNTTTAETAEATGLTAFGSDGFTVGSLAQLNTNTDTYVAWNWKANGAGSTNTAGTITSTVSVNTTSGFSIVTYTGTGSAATVGHGLGVAPAMVVVKRRNSTGSWPVYHASLPSANYELFLERTDAQGTPSNSWNNTAPTSTVFSIGTGTAVNTNTGTYVAYCFAPVAGYSAFGSVTGNGSADGPFVYTGFRPRYVLTKRTDSTGGWVILDSARDPYNVSGNILQTEISAAEVPVASYPTLDILSNGFKIRSSTIQNASGATYIYAVFAENAFKVALAR